MQIRKKGGMKFKKNLLLGNYKANSVKIGKSSKFITNPVIYAKKLIIMLTQFKFGHILA
jgi:hypothetical protein